MVNVEPIDESDIVAELGLLHAYILSANLHSWRVCVCIYS